MNKLLNTNVVAYSDELLELQRDGISIFVYISNDIELIALPGKACEVGDIRWPTVVEYMVKDRVKIRGIVLQQLLCSELEYDTSKEMEITSKAVRDPKVVDVLQCIRTTYVQNIALEAFRCYVDWLYKYIDEYLCYCDEGDWFNKFIEGHMDNFPDNLPLEFNTENIENIIQQWKDAQENGYQIFAYCCGQPILCPDYISRKSAAKVLDGIGVYFLAVATFQF